MQDFAVVDTTLEGGDNIQCIWCGMFMDASALAMHFSELHPDDVEVPKCNLCLQVLLIALKFCSQPLFLIENKIFLFFFHSMFLIFLPCGTHRLVLLEFF